MTWRWGAGCSLRSDSGASARKIGFVVIVFCALERGGWSAQDGLDWWCSCHAEHTSQVIHSKLVKNAAVGEIAVVDSTVLSGDDRCEGVARS